MPDINPKIFKKYDIRGSAEGDSPDLTAEVARTIGRAFGTYLQHVARVETAVIGRDNRRTSYDLQYAFIDGLRGSGCAVIDVGLVATPIVYWHAVNRNNCGGVMVTASHLGPDQNGFKLCVGSRTIHSHDIQLLRSYIQNNNYAYGDSPVTVDSASYRAYITDIEKRLTMGRPLHVVIDAGNGMGGLFAPRLFRTWGHTVTGIYTDPDASYPNHPANPQEEANVRDLCAKVVKVGADIGIAFDGDVDRIGVVDEKGQMIAADRVLALLARDMLVRHPGAAVVADVLTSQVTFDVIEGAGGVAFMAPSGHSLVKDMMRERSALLGGEMSGHIFLGEDYFGYDDGFFAAGRVLQLLSSSNKPLSALDDSLPRLYSTPEYRPHCPDDDKDTVIDGVKQALSDKGKVTDVDGLRIQFEKGWGLLRASNTEPVLSLRFEAATEADALHYRDLFARVLREYPQVEPIV